MEYKYKVGKAMQEHLVLTLDDVDYLVEPEQIYLNLLNLVILSFLQFAITNPWVQFKPVILAWLKLMVKLNERVVQ